MKVLTRREVRIVGALADTMFPDGGSVVGADGARVVEAVDAFMSQVPRTERIMMRGMFALFEVGIGAFGPDGLRGSFRFSKASSEERRRYVAGLEASDIYLKRLAFQALRSTFLIAYMQSNAVLSSIGVDDGEKALERWRQRRAPVSDPMPATRQELDSPASNKQLRREAGRVR